MPSWPCLLFFLLCLLSSCWLIGLFFLSFLFFLLVASRDMQKSCKTKTDWLFSHVLPPTQQWQTISSFGKKPKQTTQQTTTHFLPLFWCLPWLSMFVSGLLTFLVIHHTPKCFCFCFVLSTWWLIAGCGSCKHADPSKQTTSTP